VRFPAARALSTRFDATSVARRGVVGPGAVALAVRSADVRAVLSAQRLFVPCAVRRAVVAKGRRGRCAPVLCSGRRSDDSRRSLVCRVLVVGVPCARHAPLVAEVPPAALSEAPGPWHGVPRRPRAAAVLLFQGRRRWESGHRRLRHRWEGGHCRLAVAGRLRDLCLCRGSARLGPRS
jgi:hypothetical protein